MSKFEITDFMSENVVTEKAYIDLKSKYKNLADAYFELTEYSKKQKEILQKLKNENEKLSQAHRDTVPNNAQNSLEEEKKTTLISEYFEIINKLSSEIILSKKIVEIKKDTENTSKFAYVKYKDFKEILEDIINNSKIAVSFEEIISVMTSFNILWVNEKSNRIYSNFLDRESEKTIQIVKIRREILGISKDSIIYEYRKEKLQR